MICTIMQSKQTGASQATNPATVETAGRIGNAIREQRRQQGLNQAELAKAARVSIRTLSQIEAGKPTIRLDVLLRTLGALGMEIDLRTRRTVWNPVGTR